MSVLIFAIVAASFSFGYHRAGKDFNTLDERVDVLNEQLEESRELQYQLRDDAAVFQRTHELDNAAMQAAKDELANVQSELVELREELVFYQSLLNPEDRTPGLHIQSLDLDDLGNGLYSYMMVLTQVHQNGRFTKGQVFLGLPEQTTVGEEEASTTEWKITEQLDKQSFQFKFFQRIAGQLQLDAAVIPQQLMIKVEPAGRRLKSFEQLYDWETLVGESL